MTSLEQDSVELTVREASANKPRSPSAPRRRTRLARGPLTIGEPAPPINVRLSAVDPYRPDTVADGGEAFGVVTRAASVRGLFKRYLGGSRQDDFCMQLHVPTRTLLVAVADGVSAAPRSHLGAALAVRQAAAAVVRQLEAGAAELDWSEVFSQAAWALVEEHRRACSDSSARVEDAAASLATTLTVAALTTGEDDSDGGGARDRPGPRKHRLQVAAIGDSPTLVLSRGKFVRVVGEEDPEGLIGGRVEALPRHTNPAVAEPRALEPEDVLLVCTDGLALPLADGKGEVGRTLTRELANPPDIVDFARLLDFSRSTYDDDRTLVAVWTPARP
ncbi:MAG TPA: protein phosphatase 2C domain-containing protein [Solirubrobacteraceae bacterium]|nr:protein phosphatase 2C domain-containing protein [Solirubrobacteraceae bacterium]